MHEIFMKKAIELAKRGAGYVDPNPMVGAVIVKNDKVIAEGWHKAFGQAHAEVDALSKTKIDLQEATMYVNLEPCSHYGKTPPCVKAIIEARIGCVVIGMKDPNPLVAGRGIQALRDAGINVVENVLNKEALALNKIFIKFITHKKPWVHLKTAMTLDGKIATHTGESKWITSEPARTYVHSLRQAYKGIMVGVGTVIEDDPMLNVRLEDVIPNHPIRIVLDTHGRIPLESKLLSSSKEIPVWVFVSKELDKKRIKTIVEKGGRVFLSPLIDNRIDLDHVMTKLGEENMNSVLLEGGGTLNWTMLKKGNVDSIDAFIAPKIVGGKNAITPVEGTGIKEMKEAIMCTSLVPQVIGNDLLISTNIVKGGN